MDDQPAESATEQGGTPGPWHERLPHFKPEFRPSAGNELQSEYLVPIEHAYRAITALQELGEWIAPHQFVSEIRTIDADRLWMSPSYLGARVGLHTTWKPDREAVARLLPLIEQKLAPYDPVPHWGKLFSMSPSVLRSRYARMADFRELLRHYDPLGKFRNDFLSRYIFSG